MKTTPLLAIERRIASGERGTIVDRWRYGRGLLVAKAGRKQLPHGLIATLVAEADSAGIKGVNEREIQRRLKAAETYRSEAEVRRIATDFASWRALVDAGFPAVEPDGTEPEDLASEGATSAPDEWEQLQLDIPGLKPSFAVRGRHVDLVRGPDGATIADVAAYRDMCQEMQTNFGKTIDHINQSLAVMREGAGGDDTANAVEAWEAATSDGTERADAPVGATS